MNEVPASSSLILQIQAIRLLANGRENKNPESLGGATRGGGTTEGGRRKLDKSLSSLVAPLTCKSF
jgi:hypothetical protein